jgi:hypothetical protein
LREPHVSLVQAVNCVSQLRDSTCVFNHVICSCQTILAACLRRENRSRLIEADGIPRDEPLQLNGLIHIDDENAIEMIAGSTLDEQWNCEDDVGTRRLVGSPFHVRTDERMKNGFDVQPRARIGEDALAQCAPVKFTVGAEDPRSELLDHRGESRLSRRDDEPGRFVRVDHRDAQLDEPLRYGALAACDAAGEPNAQALVAAGNTQTSSLGFEAGDAQVAVDQRIAIEHGEPTGRCEIRAEGHWCCAVSAAEYDH